MKNLFDPGKFLAPQGRPEIRKYPDGDEFIAKTIGASSFYTAQERTLFTCEKPHGAIDVYLQGGGGPILYPEDSAIFFLWAINGGVRSLVAKTVLFAEDFGPVGVPAGPIYLFGARVAAERYECSYVTIAPGTVGDPTNDLLITAYATRWLPEAPALAGAYYRARGWSGTGAPNNERKGHFDTDYQFGAGSQIVLARGVNTTATRLYWQLWDTSNPLSLFATKTCLVWTVNIPASGEFLFELPADPAANTLTLRYGCAVGISSTPGTYTNVAVGSVLWNAIVR